MTISRLGSQPLHQVNPTDVTAEIERFLLVVHQTLSNIIGSSGHNWSASKLLKEAWKGFEKNALFVDFEALNEFFNSLKTNCDTLYSTSDFPKSLKSFYESIINFYHILAKYRYLFSQMGSDDSPVKFTEMIAAINQEYALMAQTIDNIDPQMIMDRYDSLTITLIEIVKRLENCGAGELNFSLNSQDIIKPEIAINNLIRQQLNRLKPVSELNFIIDSYNEKIKEETCNINAKALLDLQLHIQELRHCYQDIRKKILDELREAIEDHVILTKKLIDQYDFIQNKLFYLKEIMQEIFVFYQKISLIKEHGCQEISQGAKILIANCQQQQSNQWAMWSRPNKDRQTLIKFIQQETPIIVNLIEKFLQPHLGNHQLLKKSHNRLLFHQAEKKQLEGLIMKGEALTTKSNFLFDQAALAFAHMERCLTIQSESMTDFINQFLKRHWEKLLGCSLGFGGSAAVTTAFLVAHPINIVLLALAGGVIGASVGSGSGLIQDQLKSKKQLESNQTQNNPLTRWYTFHPNPIADLTPEIKIPPSVFFPRNI